jgi:hypothetical protein
MTFIKLNDQPHKTKILSNLAQNIGRRMGMQMKTYDATAVKDSSGGVHWMYVFDEHEDRIYRTHNGTQRFEDIDLGTEPLIDLNDIEQKIKTAIDRLIIRKY